VVDTLGLILALVVHPANVQDRDGALLVFLKLLGRFPRLQKIWADGGYAGNLVAVAGNVCGWVVEIVKRRQEAQGFEVQPHRWIVERTLGWFGRYRRLSKDYEGCTQSSEAMIYLAMIHRMARRLHPA
jgi:putative transposase